MRGLTSCEAAALFLASMSEETEPRRCCGVGGGGRCCGVGGGERQVLGGGERPSPATFYGSPWRPDRS
jgi:hypothetical protein